MPVWLILALITALFWAIGQIFSKKGFSHIPPLWNNIFANAFALLLWVPAVLFLNHFAITLPPFHIFLAIILTGFAYMVFFYAVSKGEISLTASLWAMYPISTVILSCVFLHERITFFQTIGIFSALLGGFLIAFPEKHLPKQLTRDPSWIWWGSIGALISGTGDFFSKVATNAIGAYSQIFFLACILQVLSIGNYFIDKKNRKLPAFSMQAFLPTIVGTFFAVVGSLIFLLSLNFGKASLVAPASSIFPLFTVFFAVVFLKEKITKKQFLGILSIIVGIIFIGIGV